MTDNGKSSGSSRADSSKLDSLIASITAKRSEHLEDLKAWLRIPSVSGLSRHKDDVCRAADWVKEKLQRSGLTVELIETERHPIVLAETPAVDGAPTVLVYGHYDVQPAEPFDEWISGAFEPTERDGNLYARGATDDKGQLLTHVQSVCECLADGNQLPIQIKFVIEGEEEVGSASLEKRLPEWRERLACDCVVISDSSQYADGQPAITYGLRGVTTFDLKVQGPGQDLHSGAFGGTVMNPANALCKMLSEIVDERGVIRLPDYYENVVPLTEEERRQWEALPSSDDEFAKSIGVDELFGEEGFTTDERRWARPTFDINGITSGHQGEGPKTIIPASASAKLSFRLVPNQTPNELEEKLNAFLTTVAPPGIRWTLHADHGAPGMVTNIDTPFAVAADAAIEAAFGAKPVFIREGGSIPIVGQFQEVLGCDCLLLGWGLSDDNLHSPNEKFRISDYYRGIEASARLWYEIAERAKS